MPSSRAVSGTDVLMYNSFQYLTFAVLKIYFRSLSHTFSARSPPAAYPAGREADMMNRESDRERCVVLASYRWRTVPRCGRRRNGSASAKKHGT